VRVLAFLLGLLLITIGIGCVRDPLRPQRGEPIPAPLGLPDIDITPQWSHDGRFVAYQRTLVSSDGPAGIFIIPSRGGTPRFVASCGYCECIRFSPDDRYIAFDRDGQLILVDRVTGLERAPAFATFGVAAPDWSPNGTKLVYQRRGSANYAPIESLGVHVLDLSTGNERPLMFRDTVQFGLSPIWSPQGDAVAVRQNMGDYWRIAVVRLDGLGVQTLTVSPRNGVFGAIRRHFDPLLGSGLCCDGPSPLGRGPFFMDWSGSVMQRMPRAFNPADAYSSDGNWGVGSRFVASDSLTALFVYKAGDFTGATCRQLTHYSPPRSAMAAITLVKRSSGASRNTR
jgi:hypothetical protein